MNSAVNSTIRIAQLLHLLDGVKGRKKLQKLVHILQELGHPFPEPFEYSYYGMYSTRLRSELDVLVAEGLITESPVPGQSGYAFEVTAKLKDFMARPALGSKQPSWTSLATDLNRRSPQELEAISTLLVLRNRGLRGAELKRRLLALKPHLGGMYDRALEQTESLESQAVK
jgi:uncharacterized protein YwgA